jgi:tetratricopeptide (TPR) repeat protein
VRRRLVILICLVASACSATGPGPRPRASGFVTAVGVVDPYGDGKQHLTAGRYELAIQRFGQALANDRRSLDALNGLAIAYMGLGRFEVAQTYFERALQVDATNAVTLNNYGWSLIQQGRLRDAKPFLEVALGYGADADLPVIAANIESLRQARPSALAAALEQGSPSAAASGQRIVRIGANLYSLKAMAGPVGRPEAATAAYHALSPRMALRQQPAAVDSPKQAPAPTKASPSIVEGTDAGDDVASAAPFRAAGSNLDMPSQPRSEVVPTGIRPDSEAAAILPGENE